MSKFDLDHDTITGIMIKKRSYCADSVPIILVCAFVVLIGICLFLLLQHVPMKQMMYAFSENHTMIPLQQAKQVKQAQQVIQSKQATSSKMAFVPIQAITHAPLKLTKVTAHRPTTVAPFQLNEVIVPHTYKLNEVLLPNTFQLTPISSKKPTYTTFQLTPVSSQKPYKKTFQLTPISSHKKTSKITPTLTHVKIRPIKLSRKMYYVRIVPEGASH